MHGYTDCRARTKDRLRTLAGQPGYCWVVAAPETARPRLASDLRGLPLDWQAGPPAAIPGGEDFARLDGAAFPLRGFLPLSPAHLKIARVASGWRLSWIRRGRIGADSWTGEDIPLGEASERYRIEVLTPEGAVRTVETTAPEWVYSDTERNEDFPPAAGGAPAGFSVAQLSDAAGPGGAAFLDAGGVFE